MLARRGAALTGVTQQAIRQNDWRAWLGQYLPEGLAPHLSGVVERDGALVIFAESAAWSARLRFALQELDARIRTEHPRVTRISVRVMPRNSNRR